MSASLKNIVDVSVQISASSAVSGAFDLGLIIGNSQALKDKRIKVYSYETYSKQMIEDGFSSNDAEYIAAGIYFSQNVKSSQLAIGYMGATETPVQALQACRAQNSDFYLVCFSDELENSQIEAVSSYVESASLPTVFVFSTNDVKCIQSATDNILKTLSSSKYTRTFGFYSSDSNVPFAVIGLASAYNTLLPNSAYTMSYKTLVGVTADNLDDSQLNYLLGYNGNAYCMFGNTYSFVYPAISSGSYHMDEIYLIDSAKYLIQNNVINGLVKERKVPQTESGMSIIKSYIISACQTLLDAGMIAPGIWRGEQVLNLNNGDAVANGFLVQSGSILEQSAEDKSKRIAPPFYVALLSSGAIEHVVISVYISK